MFFIRSTPITIAVIESPGIPKTSAGIQAPARAALFEVVASAMPSIEPLPYSSGLLLNRLETAIETHAAISPPAPGNIPISAPIPPERIACPFRLAIIPKASPKNGSDWLDDYLLKKTDNHPFLFRKVFLCAAGPHAHKIC